MLKDRINIETKQKYWRIRTKVRKIFQYLCTPSKWKTAFVKIGQELGKSKKIKNRNSLYRKDFFENIKSTLDEMPNSNGSRYYNKQDVKIAIVADEFLYDSFKDIANFIYVKPDTYREYIGKVDFFLVASAWRGLNDEWRLMATEGTENNIIIHEAIESYKKAGVTVVFYSKEDPPNYEHFLPIAKKCDVIFTSCQEKVEEYKRDCHTDNVYVMEFCINPVFHNPIGMCNAKRTDGVFFAGSWMLKYPERIKSMEVMLDGVIEAGKELVIADRNFSQNNITYFFPSKYYQYLTKEIPHDYLQKVHKLYQWAININSITDSHTMFANRVYELQANGCLMISNRSIGVEEKFKEVIIVNSKEEVERALTQYTEEEIYEHQISGVRRVMTGETNYDRILKMFDALEIHTDAVERSILVIAESMSAKLQQDFQLQTYKNKMLIPVSELTDDIYEQYDIVTRWNDESSYGKYYLEDMVNGFKYTNSDYITKDAYYSNGSLKTGIEHDYVNKILNIYATVVWRETMNKKEFLDLKDNVELENGYSIDRFQYAN